MMHFQNCVNTIKVLRDTSDIAKEAARSLGLVAFEYQNEHKAYLIHLLNKTNNILVKTKSTEPALRNTLNYLLFDIELEDDIVGVIRKRTKEVEDHFNQIEEKIALVGMKKIINRGAIFIYGYNSAVIEILKKAKEQGKNFIVHNTEARPLFEGRKAAQELSKLGISMTHSVDSAAAPLLKRSDIMLIGAKSITSKGEAIVEAGSGLFSEVADKYGVPIYVCLDSWNFDIQSIFDYKNTKLEGDKIWANVPAGIKINKNLFEKINEEMITGVISEIGIYNPRVFVEEIRRVYKWL